MSNPIAKIREELNRRGWCKNTLEDLSGRVCLVGAARVGLTGKIHGDVPILYDAIAATGEAAQELFPERVEYGRSYGSRPTWNASVRFNNHPDTTIEDMREMLDRAEKIWERDHESVQDRP